MRFLPASLARFSIVSSAAIAACAFSVPAQAGVGDLLVAPTRVILDSNRGTEIVLNNIGSDVANYRISLQLQRMDANGNLSDVPDALVTEHDKSALSIISYAPRRVTLPPNQPQAIRVGIRAPAELPDGEYRAHMLFQAIPQVKPVDEPQSKTVTVKIIPIYGVMIPIIVRKGNLTVTAQIQDVHLGTVAVHDAAKSAVPALDFTLARGGTRSVYGNIRVLRSGVSKPVFEQRGIAIYAELNKRNVQLPLKPQLTDEQIATLKGPVTIEYREPDDLGGGLITSVQTVLR